MQIIKAQTHSPEWHAIRASGIGGSEAAAVLGLSKWKTPLQVWREKRGDMPPQVDNEPMLWGRVLEPVIREQYAERTGRTVSIVDGVIRNEQYPFMLANLDGFTNDNRLLEVKTARSGQDWGEPGTDEIPQAYMIQVQHYLAVTGLEVADVAVLIAGSDFRLYEVPADAELQGMIIEAEAEFWQMVQDGTPPDSVNADDVAYRYRVAKEGAVEANDIVLAKIAELKTIKARIKQDEETSELLSSEIKAFIGELDTLIYAGKTLATWKAQKGAERLDGNALKQAYPDIHKQFIKVGEATRRFLLK